MSTTHLLMYRFLIKVKFNKDEDHTIYISEVQLHDFIQNHNLWRFVCTLWHLLDYFNLFSSLLHITPVVPSKGIPGFTTMPVTDCFLTWVVCEKQLNQTSRFINWTNVGGLRYLKLVDLITIHLFLGITKSWTCKGREVFHLLVQF